MDLSYIQTTAIIDFSGINFMSKTKQTLEPLKACLDAGLDMGLCLMVLDNDKPHFRNGTCTVGTTIVSNSRKDYQLLYALWCEKYNDIPEYAEDDFAML